METYKIEISDTVHRQIADAGFFCAAEYQDTELAKRRVIKIYSAIEECNYMPNRFACWDKPPSSVPNLRYFLKEGYVVLFSVDDDALLVSVIAVLHHARDIQAFLDRNFA